MELRGWVNGAHITVGQDRSEGNHSRFSGDTSLKYFGVQLIIISWKWATLDPLYPYGQPLPPRRVIRWHGVRFVINLPQQAGDVHIMSVSTSISQLYKTGKISVCVCVFVFMKTMKYTSSYQKELVHPHLQVRTVSSIFYGVTRFRKTSVPIFKN